MVAAPLCAYRAIIACCGVRQRVVEAKLINLLPSDLITQLDHLERAADVERGLGPVGAVIWLDVYLPSRCLAYRRTAAAYRMPGFCGWLRLAWP